MTAINDPLAGLTTKQIWQDCVWYSTESHTMKLFLLCIGRFFNDDGGASSMSLSQIVRECGFSEDTAKRCLKRAREFWLKVGVQQGFLTRFGRQNLYHAVLPPKVLQGLREHRARQQQARQCAHEIGVCAVARAVLEGGAQCPPVGGGTVRGVTPIQTPSRVDSHEEAVERGSRVFAPREGARSSPFNPLNAWDGG